jgi:hypothetical protein
MLQRLFGGGLPPARILIAPGAVMPDALLQRHRRRHRAVVGERRAGQTTNFTIFSDGSPDGDAAAAAMLQVAEPDYAAVQQWFKGITPPNLPFYVYTDPDAGGAFHITCAGTDVHVSGNPARAPGFLTAEVVEVFEDALANGWDCGYTNGEVLSRVLAFERHPEIAPDFLATEQDWWQQGHGDYVNDNSAGDRDQLANGCGDLFLYYVHGQLTFSWADIIAAGGGSLGATYQALTGYEGRQGFNDFINVLSTIDRGDGLDLPASGNPFPIKA